MNISWFSTADWTCLDCGWKQDIWGRRVALWETQIDTCHRNLTLRLRLRLINGNKCLLQPTFKAPDCRKTWWSFTCDWSESDADEEVVLVCSLSGWRWTLNVGVNSVTECHNETFSLSKEKTNTPASYFTPSTISSSRAERPKFNMSDQKSLINPTDSDVVQWVRTLPATTWLSHSRLPAVIVSYLPASVSYCSEATMTLPAACFSGILEVSGSFSCLAANKRLE